MSGRESAGHLQNVICMCHAREEGQFRQGLTVVPAGSYRLLLQQPPRWDELGGQRRPGRGCRCPQTRLPACKQGATRKLHLLMLIDLGVCAPPPNGSYWTLSDRAPKCLLSICYTLTPSSFASAFRRAEHVINLPRIPPASTTSREELDCLIRRLSAATIPFQRTARTAAPSSNTHITCARVTTGARLHPGFQTKGSPEEGHPILGRHAASISTWRRRPRQHTSWIDDARPQRQAPECRHRDVSIRQVQYRLTRGDCLVNQEFSGCRHEAQGTRFRDGLQCRDKYQCRGTMQRPKRARGGREQRCCRQNKWCHGTARRIVHGVKCAEQQDLRF